jgi:hypothetical protein
MPSRLTRLLYVGKEPGSRRNETRTHQSTLFKALRAVLLRVRHGLMTEYEFWPDHPAIGTGHSGTIEILRV